MNNLAVIEPYGDFVGRFLDGFASDNTKRDYKSIYCDFFGVNNTWEVKIDQVKTITVIQVQNYVMKHLPKPSTEKKVSALSSLYEYVIDTYEQRIVNYNPFKNKTIKQLLKRNLKKKDNLPKGKILSEDEIKETLDYIKGKNIRDYLLFRVLLNCGLRRDEVRKVKWCDFTKVNDEWFLQIVDGKGRKDRVVYISDDLANELQQWGEPFKLGESQFKVFSISGDWVNKIVKKYCEDITAHRLRHSAASHIVDKMIDAGYVDLIGLQEFLGHSDLKTTQRYVHRINMYKNNVGKFINF